MAEQDSEVLQVRNGDAPLLGWSLCSSARVELHFPGTYSWGIYVPMSVGAKDKMRQTVVALGTID